MVAKFVGFSVELRYNVGIRGVGAVHKKLKAKRKLLNTLQTELVTLERDRAERLKILRTSCTREEAYELVMQGEASEEEFDTYVQNLECLESFERWYPQIKQNLRRDISGLKSEVQMLEKQCRREHTIIFLLFMPIVAPLADRFFKWLETHGWSVHPLIYDALS